MKKIALLLAFLLVFSLLIPGLSAQAAPAAGINRFNVMVVLDASNSMNYTDPSGLRYEAIGQFIDLLAEKGNYLGGAVFSNDVAAMQPLTLITDRAGKDRVSALLRSYMSTAVTETMGYTNIGAALTAAMDQLTASGSPDLPSVILFLSDGNTEMPDSDSLTQSLDAKADAIERARTQGVQIYSVCLNSNSRADFAEMAQISSSTGGEAKEVKSADDLTDVFHLFYTLIYGTSAIDLGGGVIPESGVLETPFEVPGIGVEEINIVINGRVTDLALRTPDGSDSGASTTASSATYTLVKTSHIVPGTWTLVTRGVPGDRIQIIMIPNPDLAVDLFLPASGVHPGEPVTVRAALRSSSIPTASPEQCVGYSAQLLVKNAFHEVIERIPMTLGDTGYTASYTFPEGAYFLQAHVSGYDLERTSQELGPVLSRYPTPDPEPVNNPPVPVKDEVVYTVNIWPFFGGSLTVDMSTLATDEEDDQLAYTLLSSSFMEGQDYTLEGSTISLTHFSLSKGSFDVRATDSGGLSCDIHVLVRTVNIGLITVLLLLFLGLVAVGVIVFLIIRLSRTPFYGKLTVRSYVSGTPKGSTRTPKRGKCLLSVFDLDPIGLNYRKSYFQATRDRYVWLNTDVPVTINGQKGKKFRINSGVDTTVTVQDGDPRRLVIRFDSSIRPGVGKNAPRRSRKSPPGRPAPGAGGMGGRTGGGL